MHIELNADEVSTVTKSLDVRAETWDRENTENDVDIRDGAMNMAELAEKIRAQAKDTSKQRIVIVVFDDDTQGEDPTTEVFGPFTDEVAADEWVDAVARYLEARKPTYRITRLETPLQPEDFDGASEESGPIADSSYGPLN